MINMFLNNIKTFVSQNKPIQLKLLVAMYNYKDKSNALKTHTNPNWSYNLLFVFSL